MRVYLDNDNGGGDDGGGNVSGLTNSTTSIDSSDGPGPSRNRPKNGTMRHHPYLRGGAGVGTIRASSLPRTPRYFMSNHGNTILTEQQIIVGYAPHLPSVYIRYIYSVDGLEALERHYFVDHHEVPRGRDRKPSSPDRSKRYWREVESRGKLVAKEVKLFLEADKDYRLKYSTDYGRIWRNCMGLFCLKRKW